LIDYYYSASKSQLGWLKLPYLHHTAVAHAHRQLWQLWRR